MVTAPKETSDAIRALIRKCVRDSGFVAPEVMEEWMTLKFEQVAGRAYVLAVEDFRAGRVK